MRTVDAVSASATLPKKSFGVSQSQRVSWISLFTPTGYGAIAGTIGFRNSSPGTGSKMGQVR